MTVCIAAICGSGYVIGAADRMLTAGDIQFQPAQSKVQQITSSVVLMMAGDASLQGEIVQRVLKDVTKRVVDDPENWWMVGDVADLYYEYCTQTSLKKAEGELLAPPGLTVESFYSQQKVMDSTFVRQIATELINYDMPDVGCICCGIDPSGPHIYIVDKQGVRCQDLVGFASVGVGMWHSNSQLMFVGHTRLKPPAETLLSVYSAKNELRWLQE